LHRHCLSLRRLRQPRRQPLRHRCPNPHRLRQCRPRPHRHPWQKFRKRLRPSRSPIRQRLHNPSPRRLNQRRQPSGPRRRGLSGRGPSRVHAERLWWNSSVATHLHVWSAPAELAAT
jgi:hypothetical protein